jgi:hypothetical protein
MVSFDTNHPSTCRIDPEVEMLSCLDALKKISDSHWLGSWFPVMNKYSKANFRGKNVN